MTAQYSSNRCRRGQRGTTRGSMSARGGCPITNPNTSPLLGLPAVPATHTLAQPKRPRPNDEDESNKAQKVNVASTPGGRKAAPPQVPRTLSPLFTSAEPVGGWAGSVKAVYSIKRMKHRKEEFLPGAIIRAFHYEDHFEQDPVKPQDRVDSSKFAGPRGNISFKERILVVVHNFSEHCVTVPVFSFGGKGLQSHSKETGQNFTSICDHRAKDKFEKQNTNLALMTEFMAPGIHNLHPRSVVGFTYPISIYHKLEVVIEGYLTKDATIVLQNYYYHHAGKRWVLTNKELQDRTRTTLLAQEEARRKEFEENRTATATGTMAGPQSAPKQSWAAVTAGER